MSVIAFCKIGMHDAITDTYFSDRLGKTISNVNYAYEVIDLPKWVIDAQKVNVLNTTFEIFASIIGKSRTTVVLTNEGWKEYNVMRGR